LFTRIEIALNLLRANISSASKTAQAFKTNQEWQEIAIVAQADYQSYQDAIYNDIAMLAAAAARAWYRCNNHPENALTFEPPNPNSRFI
ncbi:MAG: hypothetical protein AB1489_31275, partial [Acidobacteriota bacterium]